MPGDYTRFLYKPEKRYSGVLMQQGRVQLDADWNEQVAILKRRWELQAMDTFGRCTVPTSIAENGSAFEIGAAKANLEIGVGRMYVDGLVAENFEKVRYTLQPFYPEPPALSNILGPATVSGRAALVYLDVWERELTYVQDRDLLEKALLGPDTTTRMQTVWQVKVHQPKQVPGVNAGKPVSLCGTDLDELFPPSGGRLSCQAVEPPSTDDPCILPPTGGYRGLENRLYRVEIHNPGTAAGDLKSVRFKWSRENASVVSPVDAIDQNRKKITIARIGRDKVLRFRIGDWVEVLDDHRELMETPGQMARIEDIDEANRIVTLNVEVEADFDATPPKQATRHTRIIRWDQSEKTGADGITGLVAGSASLIPLDDGVEIRLTTKETGWFHRGDYWVFAARTADGSVEELDEAPPRGIIHHYCALATLTGGSKVGVEDCRHRCAPCTGARGGGTSPGPDSQQQAGCCVVVDPKQGLTIQDAIEKVAKAGGGCVCLGPGEYKLTEALVIAGDNVVLHGSSLGARLMGSKSPEMIKIQGDNVSLRGITFVVAPGSSGAIVEVETGERATIEGCAFGPQKTKAASVTAIEIGKGASRATATGNVMTNIGTAMRLKSGNGHRIALNHCVGVEEGIRVERSAEGSVVLFDNSIQAEGFGIRVEGDALDATVAANTVRGAAIGIWVDASVVRIASCNVEGSKQHGLHVSGRECQIEGNRVVVEQGPNDRRALWIKPTGSENGERATILGNSFTGIAPSLIEFVKPVEPNVGFLFSRVTFSNNSCDHQVIGQDPTVILRGKQLIVVGNHVSASNKNLDSIDFNGSPVAAVGNVTTGKLVNAGSPNTLASDTNFRI